MRSRSNVYYQYTIPNRISNVPGVSKPSSTGSATIQLTPPLQLSTNWCVSPSSRTGDSYCPCTLFCTPSIRIFKVAEFSGREPDRTRLRHQFTFLEDWTPAPVTFKNLKHLMEV